ncbi:MAG: iron-containing alcohol dehydrogenase [Roseobacter sp.]
MIPFSFRTAADIRFGRGIRVQAPEVLGRFGAQVALVRGRSVPWVDQLSRDLVANKAEVHEVFCTQEPSLPMVETALNTLRPLNVDAVVAVGGGAVIDLGKAIAALLPAQDRPIAYLEGVGGGQPLGAAPLPFVAIPTTSGTGAELTKNAVILVPEAGRKVSLRDDRMLPDVAIIDPELTDNSPRAVTLSSGLDAITQVIEPYLCNKSNPMTDALCHDAIPKGLAAINHLAHGENEQARDAIAYTSMIGGMTLANAGLGAVHGLAGVMGGRLHAPHGLICGRLLGPVLQANTAALEAEGMDTARFDQVAVWIADMLDLPIPTAFAQLPLLLDRWNVPRLTEWVPAGTDLEQIANEAATSSSMRANPCELSRETLVEIIKQAI